MRMSEAGRRLLKEFEGERLTVYRDVAGYPTVGVGHLVKKGESYQVGQRISQAESDKLLSQDLARFENAVSNLVKVPISQNQFDAMVSLAFNIGEGGFQKSTVLRKVNQKDFTNAANAFLAWNKAGGRVIPGLSRRRTKERQLFLSGGANVEATASVTGKLPDSGNMAMLFVVCGIGLLGALVVVSQYHK